MNANYLNLAEIATQVKVRMQETYRVYPVTVQSSPDDMLVLCIRVFAVPENQIDEVQDFIFDLQDSLIAKNEAMLLPMVKNIEVTRQYYPEHLPPEPALSVVQIAERFLLKMVLESYKLQSAPLFPALCAAEHHTSSVNLGFDFSNTMTGKLQPIRIGEVGVAANHELALAA